MIVIYPFHFREKEESNEKKKSPYLHKLQVVDNGTLTEKDKRVSLPAVF